MFVMRTAGTPEQKAELSAMMKQQAEQSEQVDRLRNKNVDLGQTVEEQTQLLESTLEVTIFADVEDASTFKHGSIL